MRKLLVALSVSWALALGTLAQAMGSTAPLTEAELARHNAILSQTSNPVARGVVVKRKAPVVIHRAVVPQPKAAPQAKVKDPVKYKPTMRERIKALLQRWF